MAHESGADDMVPELRDTCAGCGGDLILGSVSLGLLSSPKFNYKLKAVEVSVPLKAWLCTGCGTVTLRTDDPSPIVKAHTALEATRGKNTTRLRRPS